MSEWIRYFAYGSNMLPARLRERTPSCRRVGVATLSGHALRFNQRSTGDGSAKCNIVEAVNASDQVYGVVFDLRVPERPALDRAEDLDVGYRLQHLTVELGDSVEPVFCYVAMPNTIDDSVRPFRWYRDIVLHGARRHDFPPHYLQQIQSTHVIEDPNRRRDAHHRALLALPDYSGPGD